jgi:hypothetical protein
MSRAEEDIDVLLPVAVVMHMKNPAGDAALPRRLEGAALPILVAGGRILVGNVVTIAPDDRSTPVRGFQTVGGSARTIRVGPDVGVVRRPDPIVLADGDGGYVARE